MARRHRAGDCRHTSPAVLLIVQHRDWKVRLADVGLEQVFVKDLVLGKQGYGTKLDGKLDDFQRLRELPPVLLPVVYRVLNGRLCSLSVAHRSARTDRNGPIAVKTVAGRAEPASAFRCFESVPLRWVVVR
jgi:hypothetical protein